MISIMKVLYNKIKNQHVKDTGIVIENNKISVKWKISHCRMNFVKLRIFDNSGEINLSRGIPIRFFPKLYAILTVNKPHSFLYYEGNNDTQQLLGNRTGYETSMKNGINYEDFIFKLNMHGCDGFE